MFIYYSFPFLSLETIPHCQAPWSSPEIPSSLLLDVAHHFFLPGTPSSFGSQNPTPLLLLSYWLFFLRSRTQSLRILPTYLCCHGGCLQSWGFVRVGGSSNTVFSWTWLLMFRRACSSAYSILLLVFRIGMSDVPNSDPTLA